jgi:hypothetical protein
MSGQQTMPENPLTDAVRARLEPEKESAESAPQPSTCCTLRPDVALDELQLLTHLRACLPECTSEGRIVSIGSPYLIELLQATPASPWEKLTPHRLARLLRVFGVHPRTMRFPDGVSRGYICDELRGAFAMYLPTAKLQA